MVKSFFPMLLNSIQSRHGEQLNGVTIMAKKRKVWMITPGKSSKSVAPTSIKMELESKAKSSPPNPVINAQITYADVIISLVLIPL